MTDATHPPMLAASDATHTVRAAFMPLIDAAPLIVAARMGFAEREGLHLLLDREPSWATLRDRVAVGHLDAAHMLAPMPIAANLGLTALPVQLIVPMALGFGGNTVTVSQALRRELGEAGADDRALQAAAGAGHALAAVVRRRGGEGRPRLAIGVVHTHSAHFYQLAYWLAAVGIDPLRDLDVVVVPPPLMAAALAGGQIDAFCAGEPWGSVAQRQAGGHVLFTNGSIWQSSPEKVLGVRRDWFEADPARTHALVRALHRAAEWSDEAANAMDLVRLLAASDALALPEDVIAESLARRRTGSSASDALFLAFARQAADFPWLSHASWFYAQMTRWRQAAFSAEGLARARTTYRPDIFRAALAPLGVDLPGANSKVEGALTSASPAGSTGGRLRLGPDAFFDGEVFDPDDVAGYLARLETAAARA